MGVEQERGNPCNELFYTKRMTKDLCKINLTRKKLKHNLQTSNNELR